MTYYHDVNKAFPAPTVYSKDGKPLLTWRVQLLPFLEQQKLFEEFKLDEPWDSPHNIKLLAKMPPQYIAHGRKGSDLTTTCWQVFVGNGAAFEVQKGYGCKTSRTGARIPC